MLNHIEKLVELYERMVEAGVGKMEILKGQIKSLNRCLLKVAYLARNL